MFTNHACAELISNTSALEKVFEIDEDSKYDNCSMSDSDAQQRALLFSALHVGPESMVNHTSLRDVVTSYFKAF